MKRMNITKSAHLLGLQIAPIDALKELVSHHLGAVGGAAPQSRSRVLIQESVDEVARICRNAGREPNLKISRVKSIST